MRIARRASMEYDSLLQRIEDQKNNQDISEKLYRYSALIEAIDFFSQQLNFEQIIDAAFDFINELLMVEHSVLFCFDDSGSYVLKKAKGFQTGGCAVKNNKRLENLAKFHGNILYGTESMAKYFEEDVLNLYKVKLIIPLMVGHDLYGFALISNKTAGDYSEDDHIISEVLMKLFNTALSNYKRQEVLQKANLSLDEKIFNLFAINQSSRALLSELNLDVLYGLSIDIFSELTQSSVTGFILYDEKSERYGLKAFKDIYRRETEVLLSLGFNRENRLDANKMIIDLSDARDREYFDSLFEEGIEALGELKPLYLVLLVKNNKLLGLVSLSHTVTGSEYKKSVFELIESLASSTFISLSNAQLFNQVTEQKKVIQSKLEKLINLNNLIKNINSSSRMEILLEMTLKTLNAFFDVEKALIALYDIEREEFDIESSIGLCSPWEVIIPNDKWKKVLEGNTVVINRAQDVLKYFEEGLDESLEKISGACMIPIYIDRVEIEILGILVVFMFKKATVGEEENRLALESIAGHIAPVLSNLFAMEEQQRFLLPNHIELFKKALKKEISQAVEFSLELEVLEIMDSRDFVFRGEAMEDKLKSYFSKIYPFSYNNIFVLDNEITEDAEGMIRQITGIDSIKVKQMVFGKDFGSYAEFFQLF